MLHALGRALALLLLLAGSLWCLADPPDALVPWEAQEVPFA